MYLKATFSHHSRLVYWNGVRCKHRFRRPDGLPQSAHPVSYLGHGTVHPARAETRQQPLTRKICGSHA